MYSVLRSDYRTAVLRRIRRTLWIDGGTRVRGCEIGTFPTPERLRILTGDLNKVASSMAQGVHRYVQGLRSILVVVDDKRKRTGTGLAGTRGWED